MKRILLLSFAFLTCLSYGVMAQRTVSGTVTDDTGEGLPGVNVLIKGTTTGTQTDLDGNYRLSVSDGATLVFSYVGFETQEIEVGARTTIDLVLSGATELQEVVVVGYGSTLKKELTGAVASIDNEQISRLPVNTPDQALQGLASGVFVTGSSGTPGGSFDIRVRGTSSINASNQPLYVIDGVIVQSGDVTRDNVGGQDQNVLNTINPQDIESIQVLKDASSTAIYGARGANGVVLITTKRGKAGKGNIDIRAWTGFGEFTNYYTKLNAAQQIEVEREAILNDNPGSIPLTNEELGWDGVTDTDWFDLVFRTARISEYQASASGGSEKFTFFLSGNYRDEEGIMIGSEFERFSLRLNSDYNPTDRIKISSSLSFSNSRQNVIQNDNNIYGIASAAILTPNFRPNIDPETGEYVDALPSFNTNPVRAAEQSKQENSTYRFLGNVNFTYKIIDGLDFRTDVSYDWIQSTEDIFTPAETAQGRSNNGSGTFVSNQFGTYIIEPTLRFNRRFNSHKVTAVVGSTLQQRNQLTNFVTGTSFARSSLQYIISAANITAGDSFAEEYSFNSLFGRVNYSFDEKYVASLSVRRDGSSRFGANNRFGTFWAVSAAWNFADEDFIDLPWLTIGKLRASHGITGNDRIGNFTFIGAFNAGGNYLDQPAFVPETIANPELQWEETTTTDIGLELGLFQSRVNLNVGVFRATTESLLFADQIVGVTGFRSVDANVGEIRNEGIEIELGGVAVRAGEFTWDVNINHTFLRNEVVSLVDDEPIFFGFASVVREGLPLNSFWGYNWLGVDPGTGLSVFEDVNGDGSITGDDQTVIGDHAPNFIGGITSNFSWKGVSLSVFWQYVYGVDVYNNTLQFSNNVSGPWGLTDEILRRWKQPGDITDVPRATTQNTLDNSDNSRYLSDGSYLRLKNVQLAYDFPSSITSKLKLRNLRVYATGQNLLTFTRYQGADPEVSTFGNTATSAGTEFLTFPQLKMYTFGVNIGI